MNKHTSNLTSVYQFKVCYAKTHLNSLPVIPVSDNLEQLRGTALLKGLRLFSLLPSVRVFVFWFCYGFVWGFFVWLGFFGWLVWVFFGWLVAFLAT